MTTRPNARDFDCPVELPDGRIVLMRASEVLGTDRPEPVALVSQAALSWLASHPKGAVTTQLTLGATPKERIDDDVRVPLYAAPLPSLVQPALDDHQIHSVFEDLFESGLISVLPTFSEGLAIARALAAAPLEGTGEERKPHSVNQTSTSTKFPDAADEGSGSGHAGVVISAYAIDVSKLDTITVERTRQVIGPARWAVRLNGDCLNKSGAWEWEPMPSSRDEAFMERCRFASAEEAIRAALAASGNGSGE